MAKEIKIALLGISAIVLFVIGYNYLKGSGIFSSTRVIQAEYENVQGLSPASYVQLQGFTIGSVKEIRLSEQHPGKVVITMNIRKNLPIPVDSKAYIVSLDLLGTKAVNLVKGSSTEMISNPGELQGAVIPGTIESVGASATPVIDNAGVAIASLHQSLESVRNILDANTQIQLKSTLTELNKAMKDLSAFTATLREQKDETASLLKHLNHFSSGLDQEVTVLHQILGNVDATTSNLKQSDFASAVQSLKKTLDDMQTTLTGINQGHGSLAMLMKDDQVYVNLKKTLASADALLADLKARPSRYINVSVFGRKNKQDEPQTAGGSSR